MRTLFFLYILLHVLPIQGARIQQDAVNKTVWISDGSINLQLQIDYSSGCKVSQLNIRGENTLSAGGVYTSIQTGTRQFTSIESKTPVTIRIKKNRVEFGNISFGDAAMSVEETWVFTTHNSQILWQINRCYHQNGILETMAMPAWNFSGLSTWKGGILNTGGVVWCKYLINKDDTYGVHTDGVTFWEPLSGKGFRVQARSGTKDNIACTFSQGENGEFRFSQYLTPAELGQRYNLSRFVRMHSDVFAPFEVTSGFSEISLILGYVDYSLEYDRGTLPGIDALAVRELLNTTGRYGVVDKNISGGNGWLTNWKCLHEPFFAQIGLALNDINYTRNFSSTLDQERDLAIENDGRVLARWHDVPEAENSNYNFKTGYYDCPWGYTIDAQPGQVINTAELFHQNGDLTWLRSHKSSCEKVLGWLIGRDTNENGIFEMLNDNTGEKKCSDWIDVVWASFENAFVNAQMYEALNVWAECELALGDHLKATYYLSVAARLKVAFNKPFQEGGFWSDEKKHYLYWRDKDGSLHGNNLVTPVNFAAIAFGICDDPERIKVVLDQIEEKATAENLFHWPLCFESFKPEEVHIPVNWPFPSYENGDIFLTWGYLGIRSYVKYEKKIAIKYIKNLLKQYNKDGLSSQRFSRIKQEGIGDDILAGNSTTITALYRDIYGIRPKWNRMGLEPNMTEELNGTEFKYSLRGSIYNIRLDVNRYCLSTDEFSITSGLSFGAGMSGKTLMYYPDNLNISDLSVTRKNSSPVSLEIREWSESDRSWVLNSDGSYVYEVTGLTVGATYDLKVNGTWSCSFTPDHTGIINFSYKSKKPVSFNLLNQKPSLP